MVLRISSYGDDRRIFWGLKFSIPGLFLGRKIWQVFFGGVAWFKWGFFGVFIFFRVISFNPFWEFLGLGNSAWDFFFGGGGGNFWSRDLFGFCWKL